MRPARHRNAFVQVNFQADRLARVLDGPDEILKSNWVWNFKICLDLVWWVGGAACRCSAVCRRAVSAVGAARVCAGARVVVSAARRGAPVSRRRRVTRVVSYSSLRITLHFAQHTCHRSGFAGSHALERGGRADLARRSFGPRRFHLARRLVPVSSSTLQR